jgi:capsular exopolysaccharide synthesis family protein
MTILRRRWWIVLLLGLVAGGAAAAGVATAERTWTASATLYVPVAAALSSNVGRDDLLYNDRLQNTYVAIVESESFRGRVAEDVGVPDDVRLTLHPDPNTGLMELRAQTGVRDAAEPVANAAAARLAREASNLQVDAATRQQIEASLAALGEEAAALAAERARAVGPAERTRLDQALRLVELRYQAVAERAAVADLAGGAHSTVMIRDPATTTHAQSWAGATQRIVLAAILGCIAGAGLAWLLERRAPRLDRLEDVAEAAGGRVVATVPRVRGAAFGDSGQSDAPVARAFSDLRVRLLTSNGVPPPSTVLVTSAEPGAGKSTVAANLAAAIGRSSRPVLLIDANFADPALHHLVEGSPAAGFSDLLADETVDGWGLVLPSDVENVSVLPAGSARDNTSDMLASARLDEILLGFSAHFDIVIVDASDLSSSTDPIAIARRVDAIMLVVGRLPVRAEVIRDARARLDAVGATRVSVIVNRWRGRTTVGAAGE